jgi:hypothetical protein
MARLAAAALGVLLCAAPHTAHAADGDLAGTLPAGAPLYDRIVDLPARFRYVFDSDPPLASGRARETERQVFLRNSDSLVRAKARMRLGREWLFVYADMGGGSSPLRWQGLVGIRVGQDAHLLGGWRRVTYDLSPGGEFDSLDFDGPFIGAQRAW